MSTRRHAAVSGSFYPTSAVELSATVEVLVADSTTASWGHDLSPKAIIAPHAGYAYSGAVAASAYATLVTSRARIRRVVVVGPAHYVPVRGVAVTRARAFTTPLGDLLVDQEAVSELLRFPEVVYDDSAHAPEHSVEVHLPFLQVMLGEVRIVPLLLGDVDVATMRRIIEAAWGGDETLLVVSSDLSHTRDVHEARARNDATTRAICELDGEAIGDADACGITAVRALLAGARTHALGAKACDVRTSNDVTDGQEEIVGYGAYVFA